MKSWDKESIERERLELAWGKRNDKRSEKVEREDKDKNLTPTSKWPDT